MKFALVDQQRQEAQPKLLGRCPACGHPMVSRCGEARVWHWAHQAERACDPWWENETDWHRNWKDQFPVEWQEVVHRAENGEKHIADVKTDRGWVIEFQHSYLQFPERRSRTAFYPKLIWVVDGVRRKRDREQLLKAWAEGVSVGPASPVRRAFPEDCLLIREWADSDVPVFFDLGDQQVLWWLFARSADGAAYVAPYSRAAFVESHRSSTEELAREFDQFVTDAPKLVSDFETYRRAQMLRRSRTQPSQGILQSMAPKYPRRRRF